MVSARLLSRAYSMPTHEGPWWLDEEGKFESRRKLEALGCASACHSRGVLRLGINAFELCVYGNYAGS